LPKIIYLYIFIALSLYSNQDVIDIKTFGTIGTTYNDNSSYKFRKTSLQKEGSSKNYYYYTDTILGLQGSYKLNDKFSLISQVIAQKDVNDKNSVEIDWGYLKYDEGDNFLFNIGRIKLPYYKNSNNQNIGFSRLMIREPIEVYGQVPFSSYNGIELLYSNIIDKYFYTIQANYGKEKLDTPMHSQNQKVVTTIENIKAFNITIGNDIIEARTTYMQGDASAESSTLNKLFDNLRLNNLNELAYKYEFKNKRSKYFGLGLFIDYENFIFQSEYGQRKANAFFADLDGYYATLGYRIKNFIPYLSYATTSMKQNLNINSVSNDLNDLLLIQNVAQSSNTFGFKYFINKNLDFKLEYQRIRPKGQYGGFYLSNDNYPNTELNVYSFVIDFAF
jgi:hypothetical protein